MLFITDIIDSIGVPPNTKCLETYIHANDHHVIASNSEFLVWHIQSLPQELCKNSALVFTYAKHTVAIFCDARGKFYLFDSLPAVVMHIDRDMILTHLFGREALSSKLEAFGIFISKM